MVSKSQKTVNCYKQGRYSCLACGHKGRIKGGFTLYSRCGKCSDYMIVPEKDLVLLKGPEDNVFLQLPLEVKAFKQPVTIIVFAPMAQDSLEAKSTDYADCVCYEIWDKKVVLFKANGDRIEIAMNDVEMIYVKQPES